MNNFIKLKAKVWLETPLGSPLGYGKLELLLKIKECGSILKASQELGMSYKKAWSLVEEINRCFGKEIVKKQTGGAGGGGTKLTKTGEKIVEEFLRLKKEIENLLAQREKVFEKILREEI